MTDLSAPSLHHLALRSAHVDALVAFYRDVLGLRVQRDQRPRSVWLGLGGDAVLMVEAREPGEPAPDPSGLEMFALRVDEPTRQAVAARARTLGCHDGETAFTTYLRDPEGRRVGVSTYRFNRA